MQATHFSGVSVSDLHVWRGERPVLRGVSVVAAAGDCVHVAGPNGAGKTTLLRAVAGLLSPEQGSVRWQGESIAANRDAYSASLSYLGHSDGLKADFTADENLAFDVGLRRRIGPGEIDRALARVGLDDGRGQPARVLSAGQRRRLAMARVLLAGASLWLLDEPFTNLDNAGISLITDVVAEHLDAGGAALIAAHQLPVIPRHVTRCVELS